MVATKPRYLRLGFEPGPTLDEGPFVMDDIAVAAALTIDRNISRRSIMEVVHTGITTGGTIDIPGTVNGAADVEQLTIPTGSGTITGAKAFTALNLTPGAVVLVTIAGGTIAIRVSTIVDINAVEESLVGKQKIIKADENINDRHSAKSAPGLWEEGGGITLQAEPENGLGELLTAALGAPTTTPRNGIQLESALGGIGVIAPTTQPSPAPKRLKVVVTSLTGTGTMTVNGNVNGSADSEVLNVNATGDLFTQKSFDSVTNYTTAGMTVISFDVFQVDSLRHEWTNMDELPAVFVRVGMAGNYEKEVQGLKPKTLTIGGKTDEFVMAILDLMGRTEVKNAIGAAASPSPLPPFVFTQGVVLRDGVSYNRPMEFEITETNDLNPRPGLGTRFLRDIEVEHGKTEGTLKIRLRDGTEKERFLAALGATEPGAVLTPQKLEITMSSQTLIFLNGDPYRLKITLWRAFMEELPDTISGQKVREASVKFYAEIDPTEQTTMTIELDNSRAGY